MQEIGSAFATKSMDREYVTGFSMNLPAADSGQKDAQRPGRETGQTVVIVPPLWADGDKTLFSIGVLLVASMALCTALLVSTFMDSIELAHDCSIMSDKTSHSCVHMIEKGSVR
jgi:hypothetical protein